VLLYELTKFLIWNLVKIKYSLGIIPWWTLIRYKHNCVYIILANIKEKYIIEIKKNNMKKILNLALLVILVSFTGCSTDEDEVNTQQSVLKANIDGQTIDFVNNSNEFPYAYAKLIDGKRLVINGITFANASLTLTVGETFINDIIEVGNYKIGTAQDNLETNIQYWDSNDTTIGTTSSSSEHYTGVYGCDVLSSVQQGEINITELDTANKVVSGTFTGTLFRWIDTTNGELKIIELTNGVFTLPYTEENEILSPDRDLISARVNGYHFMSDELGFNSSRSASSGLDKIKIIGQDINFGRVRIALPTNVISGNTYHYNPDFSPQTLGAKFENRINIPEILLSNNPNQSNDSYISIINHDPVANIIEGTFYTENSEIDGRTIIDGYFKTTYVDPID